MGALFGLCDKFYSHDGYSLVHTFTLDHYIILSKCQKMLTVMPVYRREGRFVLLLHLLVLSAVYKHDIFTYSLLNSVQGSENLALGVHLHSSFKKFN